jgi:hypothetical protein
MKRTIKSLSLAVLLTASTTSALFAEGTRITLNQNDWTEIEDQAILESALSLESIPDVAYFLLPEEWDAIEREAEMESLSDFENIPALVKTTIKQGSLNLDLKAGKKTAMLLEAPFAATEQVGLVVIDEKGKLVHAESGLFKQLQNLTFFSSARVKSATYIVRVYSAELVYETKLQVVNL